MRLTKSVFDVCLGEHLVEHCFFRLAQATFEKILLLNTPWHRHISQCESLGQLCSIEQAAEEHTVSAINTIVGSKDCGWNVELGEVAIAVGTEAGQGKHQQKTIRYQHALTHVLQQEV